MRPTTFQLLKQSWYFFTHNIIGIALIVVPVAAAMQFVLQMVGIPIIREDNQQIQTDQLAIFYGVQLLLMPLMQGALICFIHANVRSQHIAVLTCFSIAFSRWPRLLLTYMLYFCAVVVGLFMFILPGMLFFVRLAFAEFKVTLEGQQPLDALKQSWHATEFVSMQIFAGLVFVTCFVGLFSIYAQQAIVATAMPVLLTTFVSIIATLLQSVGTIYLYRLCTLGPEGSSQN